MSSQTFNADELEAQSRAGTRPGSGGIRNFMPEQHRSFFPGLPEIFVATVDADGWPLATILEGGPGFVRVDGDVLSIPDFRGNGYFNTLGNLLGEPRCALLFVDFESGDVIQFQGRARIDWNPAERVAGAERVWHFHMARGWYRPRAAAMRGALIDYSPVTLKTGTWVAGAGVDPADRIASPR